MHNCLVVLGNGFDLHHNIASSYYDFKNYLRSYEKEPVIMMQESSYVVLDSSSISDADKERHDFVNAIEKHIDSDELWSNFEYALSLIDAESLKEFHNDALIGYGADDWSESFHHDYQSYIEDDLSFSKDISKHIKTWILTLNTTVIKKLPSKIINNSSLFINFNYTDVLESTYKINKDRILYIHGSAKKDDHLIIGHGYKPNSVNINKDKVDYEDDFDWENEISDIRIYEADQIIEEYFVSSYKNVQNIMIENMKFFQSLHSIRKIYILGHSLSGVDIEYFKEINRIVRNGCQWFISYYRKSDAENFTEMLKNAGVKKMNISTFKLEDI